MEALFLWIVDGQIVSASEGFANGASEEVYQTKVSNDVDCIMVLGPGLNECWRVANMIAVEVDYLL